MHLNEKKTSPAHAVSRHFGDKTRETDSLHRAALGPLSLIDHVVMRPLADILHIYR